MNYGLKKTKRDPRDFSYHKTFGAIDLKLPDEYVLDEATVKNQYGSMFCTAFASCVLAQLEDGIDFSPEWFYSKEVEISGQMDGQDLRTACKAAKKYGFLPQDKAQFDLTTKDPECLANPSNWPISDELAAAPYKKKSYFQVKGDFDQIKQVLFNNAPAKRAILTGVDWGEGWEAAPGGVIKNYTATGSLHAVPIIGFKQDYIILQNSYGKEIGDNGKFYVPRGVFAQAFTEPLYMFVDTDNTTVPKPVGNWFQILTQNICQLAHR